MKGLIGIKKIIFLLFLCVVQKGEAFRISPFDVTITPKKHQQLYKLTNTSTAEEVILVSQEVRQIGEWGEEMTSPSTDLVIYPTHLTLKPGDERLVRVIWKGAKKLDSELAYRLSFEQQSVEVPKSEKDLDKNALQAAVGFGVRYKATVYVSPNDKVLPKLEVDQIEKVEVEGKQFVQFLVHNVGGRHYQANSKTLEVNVQSKGENGEKVQTTLADEDVLQLIDQGFTILAGGKRYFRIPVKDSTPKDILAIHLVD